MVSNGTLLLEDTQWRTQSSAITGADCGRATYYYKVNFDLSFEYLGFKPCRKIGEGKWKEGLVNGLTTSCSSTGMLAELINT